MTAFKYFLVALVLSLILLSGLIYSSTQASIQQGPTITLTPSTANVTRSQLCSGGFAPNPACTATSERVQLAARVTNPGGTVTYEYDQPTGGSITGSGPNVTWDLSGVGPNAYTATVRIKRGRRVIGFGSTTVNVNQCDCIPLCPSFTVDCPTELVTAGTTATVTANLSGGPPNAAVTYNWMVSAGEISEGQGTASIKVNTTGQAGQDITATLEIGGITPECQRVASCTFTVSGNSASNSNNR